MTHEELEEAVPLYAAGALDRAERQALEAHLLSGCTSCHGALKEYQAVTALMPFGLPTSPPPRTLKAKIMAARNLSPVAAEAAPEEPAKPSLEPGEWMNHLFPPIAPARSWSLPWAMAFATLLVVGGAGYLAWNYEGRLSDENAKIRQLETTAIETATKLASLQGQLKDRDQVLGKLQEDLQRRLAEMTELKDQLIQRDADLEEAKIQLAKRGGRTAQDELAALLWRPDVRVVSMAGSEMAKTSSAFLLYDAATKKVWLYAVNLPECLNGTVYQLWAIDQKPRSIGTFHMDSGETAHLLVSRITDFERAKRFAVSLEPPGGRPQPTGPVYLTGSL